MSVALIRYDAARKALAAAKSTDEVLSIKDEAARWRIAAQQAKDRKLELDAVEIRFHAERRLGELIAAQKATVGLATGGTHGGRPDKLGSKREPSFEAPPTLAEAGISKKLSSSSQKLAAMPETEFEGKIAAWRERSLGEKERVTLDLLASHVRGTLGTGENDWHTPEEYLDLARRVLGRIDLDPASSKLAQKKVQAVSYFTPKQDGLNQQWSGNVWLNPPYAQPLIAEFVSKLVAEYRSSHVQNAILLTHNYTDTAWFHEAASAAKALCFPRGRIKFINAKGELAAPTQGQVFTYFGSEWKAFAGVFGEIGLICRL